jgi:hypothetical protein
VNHFAQVHRLVKAHRLVDTIDQNLTQGTGGFVNPIDMPRSGKRCA